ncbi:carbonate dehydratase [Empedobacter stercoris]|uniref:carbonic anhydrase n=2 Tax=Empedobacter TaxID=59734 RepID=A0ABY8VAC6_9FLAO|nr:MULTISPECIES: carbonate dehydratase [Empedobacter]MCA4776433.1 carbonate dehydratase [Empedobacter stercoris]MCA4781734.1 carbonate dehydratase [Empedobacter stercoris]MCA4809232.1 carbonate dehydratase [Empedobacter stercoris]MDM1523932.1 carbonate dehydratase [Empedobacter sp. 225-1]MDM1542622.1 carbonate dehydratase [Empedobacter sp. 189-2]
MTNEYYKQILDNNKAWVESKLNLDPDFFTKLAQGQQPPLLWIGCADSRVPANEIIGAQPGEVFVHRNIANMVVHTDMNMLSVLDYAVNVLKIKDIIVCGHYGCGGVKTAMGNASVGLIDNWLRHIKDTYRFNKAELDAITDENTKCDRLVEINAAEQVLNLAKTSIVQNAWAKGQDLHVHGWVYGVSSGLVKDLGVSLNSNDDLEAVFQLNISH